MRYNEGTPIEFEDSLAYSGGMPLRVIRFAETMDVLSSAIYNGGHVQSSCIIIMQVPKDYMTDDPAGDVRRVVENLGLPDDTIGLMTAAEVEYVFNIVGHEYNGRTAYAAVTAGLSNQVVAGDVLVDWEARHRISMERSGALYRNGVIYHAGTINTVAISGTPLTLAGKANAIIAATEAKTASMNRLGYRETGTTSDAIAIASPMGDEEDYAGTGSDLGIAMARSVRDAVCKALIIRDDFPESVDDDGRQRIRSEYGL